jgi:DNA repair ATPase RecN
MIKRITIDDYMAHQHTVLELGPGVTVLTGPNNVGKSAVVEAIRSVAQNPAPEHVVRHGARQALVRVELDSGEVIEWVRKKSNAVYRLYRPCLAPADGAVAGIAGSEPALVGSDPGLGEPAG